VFVHAYRAPNVLLAFESLPPLLRLLVPAAGGAVAAALAARIGGERSMAEIMEAPANALLRVHVDSALCMLDELSGNPSDKVRISL
jgi:hypothetical protein